MGAVFGQAAGDQAYKKTRHSTVASSRSPSLATDRYGRTFNYARRQLPRTMSRGVNCSTAPDGSDLLEISCSKFSMAFWAISATGAATTVGGGFMILAKSKSSIPMTETSSG